MSEERSRAHFRPSIRIAEALERIADALEAQNAFLSGQAETGKEALDKVIGLGRKLAATRRPGAAMDPRTPLNCAWCRHVYSAAEMPDHILKMHSGPVS
jgi:hypothetical protein